MAGRSRFVVVLAAFGIAALLASTAYANRHPRRHARHHARAVIVVGQPKPVRRTVVVDGLPHGVLDMNVKPKTTQVWTNGEFRGTCGALDGRPDKLYLLPGVHRIKLVTPDGTEVSREVQVRAGLELNVGLDLR